MAVARKALHDAVWRVLIEAGEPEAPIRRARTTRRIRYVPEAPGFRLFYALDPGFADARRQYLCVGCANHHRKTLERYAQILAAAGYEVRVDRPRIRRAVYYVWLLQEIGD